MTECGHAVFSPVTSNITRTRCFAKKENCLAATLSYHRKCTGEDDRTEEYLSFMLSLKDIGSTSDNTSPLTSTMIDKRKPIVRTAIIQPLSLLRSTRCSKRVCRCWAGKEPLLPCRKLRKQLCTFLCFLSWKPSLQLCSPCNAGAHSENLFQHKIPVRRL